MKYIDADILIIGAGAAGVAAAIAATGAHSTVVLIERNAFPGGKATASSVGTVCGLYLRSVLEKYVHVHDNFVMDFVKELELKSGTSPQKNHHGLKFLPYKIEAFKQLCEERIEASGINFLKQTSIIGLKQENASISQIECEGPEGKMTITCKYIIDCSGRAVVSDLANQPVIIDESLQSAAYIFEIKGVAEFSETSIDLAIKRAALKIEISELKHYLLGTSIVPGSKNEDQMMLKMGIPSVISAEYLENDPIALKSKSMIEDVFSYLKENLPAFEHAYISHVADEMGDRIGKRPKGKYVLTREDVFSCKKFNDGIACGTWPIEKWSKGYRVNMEYFEENNFYHIPIRCLVSQNLDNLFFAGRSISADEDAIASARVIGTCLATGYASGKLALGRLNRKSETDIVDEIQAELFIDNPITH